MRQIAVKMAGTASAFIVLLAGCSGDDERDQDQSRDRDSTESSQTPEEPTQEAATTFDLALGTKVDISSADGSELNVTFEEYRRDIPFEYTDPGMRIDALLATICNVSFDDAQLPSGTLANPFNLSLEDANYGEYDILDRTPSPAPEPQLAWEVIGQGDCKRGWRAFDVPLDVDVVTASFNISNGADLASWVLVAP